MIAVDLANQQSRLSVEAATLRHAVEVVLQGERIDSATLSVALVDDTTIHDLNRRFLHHDYPTDVLSFLFSDPDAPLDGEIVISTEMALRQANQYDCSPHEELLLYLVHGTLHLLGYDDASDEDREVMQQRQRTYLEQLAGTAQRSPPRPDSSRSGFRQSQGGEPPS